jgi:hypothetical protein
VLGIPVSRITRICDYDRAAAADLAICRTPQNYRRGANVSAN